MAMLSVFTLRVDDPVHGRLRIKLEHAQKNRWQHAAGVFGGNISRFQASQLS